jgi:prophage regulatory protein
MRVLQGQNMATQIIRISELATTKGKPGKLPVSPATVWRWVREGKFPKPFKLGHSVTVWDAAEVDAFISSQAGTQSAGKEVQ